MSVETTAAPTVTQPVAPVAEKVPAPPKQRWYAALLAGDFVALWPAIVLTFIGVLVIAFAMSFHGLFVFGDLIMQWAFGLCVLAPLGVDVFSLVGLIATFLTRDAPWRVRLYCWLAFLSTVALSIGGNAVSAYALLDLDAARRKVEFVWGYRQFSALAGAALWPALSAVALHVLIVVRRHLDERRDKIKNLAEEVSKAEAAEKLLQAEAIIRAANGATAVAIVADLKLGPDKKRSVERWTEPIRAALAAAKTAVPAKSPTSPRVTARTGPKESR